MKRTLCMMTLVLLFAAPALAEEGKANAKISCKMEFSMKGWAVIYKSAEGSGAITCSNGEKFGVVLDSKGVGLAAGKAEVVDAHGMFSPVEKTEEILGTYIGQAGTAAAGDAKASAAFVKDDVSLVVYGQGQGVGLASGGARLTIKRSETAEAPAGK